MRTRLVFWTLCCLFLTVMGVAQSALTNDAIMKMTKAGLGDDLILSSIKAQPGQFSTGADDLIALKTAGVSDKVIAAMMGKGDSPWRPNCR